MPLRLRPLMGNGRAQLNQPRISLCARTPVAALLHAKTDVRPAREHAGSRLLGRRDQAFPIRRPR